MILGAGTSALDSLFQRSVNNAFTRLAQVSNRLATLKRIQTGSDDPSGLIAASNLTNQLAAMERVAASTESTRSLIHAADSALASASELVAGMQARVIAASNDTLTADQIEALQLETDAALDALDRLGNTQYAGQDIFTGQPRSILTGPMPTDVATLEFPILDTSLGGSSGQLADLRSGGSVNMLNGDLETAFAVLGEAQDQILSARAAAGAFEMYVVDSTQRLMQDTQVNLASALSAIQDTDMAAESSRWIRNRILADSSIAVNKLSQGSHRMASRLLIDIFR